MAALCTFLIIPILEPRALSPGPRTRIAGELTPAWCMQERREVPVREQKDPAGHVQLPAAAVHDAGARGGAGGRCGRVRSPRELDIDPRIDS